MHSCAGAGNEPVPPCQRGRRHRRRAVHCRCKDLQLVRHIACQGAKRGNSLRECTRRLGQPTRSVAQAHWPRRSDACNAHPGRPRWAGLGIRVLPLAPRACRPHRSAEPALPAQQSPSRQSRRRRRVRQQQLQGHRPHLLGRPSRPVLAPSAAPLGGGRAPARPTSCRARLLRAQRGRQLCTVAAQAPPPRAGRSRVVRA